MGGKMVIFCIGIVSLVFYCDYFIKNHMEKHYKEGETKSFCDGKILIRKHYNRGAMMNLGQTKQKVVVTLSVLLSVVTAVMFLLSLGKRGNNTLRIGLALLLGGAFSNTYDRLKRKYVVDYISFGVKWEGLRKVVFNLADFCIMIGSLITIHGCADCE